MKTTIETFYNTNKTQSELDKEIILQTYKILDEFRLKPKPKKPLAYSNFLDMQVDEKKQLRKCENEKSKSFLKNPEIVKYFERMMKLESERVSDADHIKWCYQNCKNAEIKEKLMDKYQELISDNYWIFGSRPNWS